MKLQFTLRQLFVCVACFAAAFAGSLASLRKQAWASAIQTFGLSGCVWDAFSKCRRASDG